MPIKLLQGDCIELMKDIPDGSIDLIVTDPPYGMTDCKWDIMPDIATLSKDIWRALKTDGALIVYGLVGSIIDWIAANRKYYKYSVVWDKKTACGFLAANYRPMRRYELLNVFYKKHGTYNPQKTPGKPYTIRRTGKADAYNTGASRINTNNTSGDRYPVDIISFARDKSGHPTGKPVALMEWIIKTYSNTGDTILDPFMGSGSTGVACVNTGRDFIGMELDPNYYTMAKERIERAIEAKQCH